LEQQHYLPRVNKPSCNALHSTLDVLLIKRGSKIYRTEYKQSLLKNVS